MGDTSLYDEDILLWSEQRDAALRSLANRRGLPNELDLANVIEKIEGVDRSEFQAVGSLIENVLVQFLLLAGHPAVAASRGWVAARLAAWDAGKAASVAKLSGTPCPFPTATSCSTVWTFQWRLL